MLLTLKRCHPYAILALADGTVFVGSSIGHTGQTIGEVVFNTSMTGYQEILTDPSYCQQMVTLTYPHIGNYGVNVQDIESEKVHAAGLIVKNLPAVASNFRSAKTLSCYLKDAKVCAIADIDTRQLTRHLRVNGSQNGCILALNEGEEPTAGHIQQAVALAKSAPNMSGLDLAKTVTTEKVHNWVQTEWKLSNPECGNAAGYGVQSSENNLSTPFHVVAYDFGVKYNILRMLAQRGCRITVVPAQTTAEEVSKMGPNGVFFSNGPGDPQPCTYAIDAARIIMDSGIPTFGICLGHQIMALASGAKTFKMKLGHHGANHPVQDTTTRHVAITSQNHGFAVDTNALPANLHITHISLFDGTIQGFSRTDVPAFGFQGHPEASPGPQDLGHLFDQFVGSMQKSMH